MAQTLDGKIARSDHDFPDWTEKADKKLFFELTKKIGVIIMGSKTYDTIGKPLPGRKNIILTRDSSRKSDHQDLFFTSDSPADILQKLEQEGHREAILAGGQQINTLFARENLIDEIVVTISPVIFGEGMGMFGEGIGLHLALKSVEKLGENSLVAHYNVLKNS